MNSTTGLSFPAWVAEVGNILRLLVGLCLRDMPDMDLLSLYFSYLDPDEAALKILEKVGYVLDE